MAALRICLRIFLYFLFCIFFSFGRDALHLFNVEKLYLLPLAVAAAAAVAAGNGSLTFVNILVIRAQTLARPLPWWHSGLANGIGSDWDWERSYMTA